MTPNIAKKIAAIAAKLPALAKGAQNKDAGFSYVSIDDYYEKIAPLVRDGGLIWTIDELDCEVVSFVGAEEPLAKFKYEFRLYDLNGETFAENPQQLCDQSVSMTVIHPLQGAQTTGSAASYAEKIFLRTLFKIVTGEPDADAFARKRGKRASPERDDFIDPPVAPRAPLDAGEPPERINDPDAKARAARMKAHYSSPANDPEPQPKPAKKKPSVVEEATVGDEASLPPLTDGQVFDRDVKVILGKLALVKSKLDLKVWRHDKNNAALIEKAREGYPDAFDDIQKAFKEKFSQFETKNEAA